MNRRTFLGVSALGSRAFALTAQSETPSLKPAPVKTFELDEITLSGLAEGMQSGKYTALSITQKYLERIEEIDKRGPGLNSVIEINPDALALAQKLDQERREKQVRGPLHGIPVLIKDNIDTADRMQTTAGSLALQGTPPTRDSKIGRASCRERV